MSPPIQITGSAPSASSTISQAYGSTVTAGSLLVMCVTWDTAGGRVINNVTDNNGNTWTLVKFQNDTTNLQGISFYYLENAPALSTTVSANFNGSALSPAIIVAEYGGIATVSSPDGTPAGNTASATNATDNATSTSMTTAVNGDLIISVIMDTDSTGTWTGGTGFTSRFTTFGMALEDLTQSSAGSIVGTWTRNNTGRYVAIVAAFKATSAGPSALPGAWPSQLAPSINRRANRVSWLTPFQLLGDQSTSAAPVDYVKSATDSVGITDARTVARGTTVSDAVGITDAVRVSVTKVISDPIGITDTRAYNDGENYTDPVGLTDSVTRVVTAVRAPADPVGITDTRAVARGTSKTDAIGITDSATGVISLTKTVTDSIGITDAQTKTRAESSGDNVGLTDAVSVTKTVVRTVSDPVGVTDTRSYNDGENYTDPLPITDAQTIARSTSRSDSIGITDARTVAVGRSRTDAVGITDTRTVVKSTSITKSDPIGITDGVTATRSIHVTIVDPVTIDDFIPTGTIRDICVTLTFGPKINPRTVSGPRSLARSVSGPRVDRAVTGPAKTSHEVVSLRANAHTVTGPRSC